MENEKKKGRPSRTGSAATKMLACRVTEAEMQLARARAAAVGQTLAEYIRGLVLSATVPVPPAPWVIDSEQRDKRGRRVVQRKPKQV